MNAVRHLRAVGTRRDGQVIVMTSAQESAADLTERLYRQRWRDLDVRDADGEQVGAIGPHPDTGKRIWWAAPPEPP